MVLLSGNFDGPFLLDALPASVRPTCKGAYAMRLLSQAYTGPVVRIRRSTDNVERDFFADGLGNLGDQLGALGGSLQTFLGGATGFVTTWYDQSGQAMNATQATNGNQPTLGRNTSNEYFMGFNAASSQFMSYGSTGTNSIWFNTNYTAVFKEQRGTSNDTNFFHGMSGATANANLTVGYRFNNTFTHAHWSNDYNMTIPVYVGGNEPIRRWTVAYHATSIPNRSSFLNGMLLGTNLDNRSLSDQLTTANFGRASIYYYTGNLFEALFFTESIPVVSFPTISLLDASLAVSNRRAPALRMTTAATRTLGSAADPRGMAGVPPSVLSSCVGAYGAQRLLATYRGPAVRLQRDTDGAQADVWMDYNGTVERVVDLAQDDGATTGGSVSYDGAYRIHTFTSSGTFVATNPVVGDVLVVGGGGAGGVRHGGGGGGGGVVYKTTIALSTRQVIIGGGGPGGNTTPFGPSSGNDSIFGELIGVRGGGGGGSGVNTAASGGSGGSVGALGAVAGSGVPSQGSSGGISPSSGGESKYAGGGGGGAASVGANTLLIGNFATGGNGGAGRLITIDGTARYFGGGGGGGCAASATAAGAGGIGGGGAGAKGFVTATNGTINTGGGGGGGGFSAALNALSGSGGSGIVIVRTLRHPGIQGATAVQQWLGASTGTVVRWYDQSGNVNHVTNIRGNPRLWATPGDAYLWGGWADGMRFPTGILPNPYTLLHTAQYDNPFTISKWALDPTGFTTVNAFSAVFAENNYLVQRSFDNIPANIALYASAQTLLPRSVLAGGGTVTLNINAYVMRTGPSAANFASLIVDFLTSARAVIGGSSINFNYTNTTLNVWQNSVGSVAVPAGAFYVRVRFGGNYNETIRLRTDTTLQITRNGVVVAQWTLAGNQQRIFDAVNSSWSSGFLRGYSGVANHHTPGLNYTPIHGTAVTSLGGATGIGGGAGSPPVLNTTERAPYVTLTRVSDFAGSYFDLGSRTWNLATDTSSGITFVGMISFTSFNGTFPNIFAFFDGASTLLLLYGNGANGFIIEYRGPSSTRIVYGVPASISLNTWYVIGARLQYLTATTGSLTVWINNTAYSTSGTMALPGANATFPTNVIGRAQNGAYYSSFSFKEIAVYNGALSDAQYTSIYDYLNQKYVVENMPWRTNIPITPAISLQPTQLVTTRTVPSLGGAVGIGAGGSAGPQLDTSTSVPHLNFNGSNQTIGDYMSWPNITFNLASRGGMTFIGMARYHNNTPSLSLFEAYTTGNVQILRFARHTSTSQARIWYRTNGQNYDWISPGTNIITNAWQTFAMRMTFTSNVVSSNLEHAVWVDGNKNTINSVNPVSITDVAYNELRIATLGGGIYNNISVREMLWYNEPLNDAQVATLHTYLVQKYTSNVAPWTPPPINPYLSLQPSTLTLAPPNPFLGAGPSQGSVVTSWNGATGLGVGGSPGPIWNTSTGIPHVSLNGQSTTVGDYLTFGTTTWNPTTTGGFTFVGMVRFNNSARSWERIFDFGQANTNNNYALSRQSTSSTLYFQVYEGSTPQSHTTANAIVNGTWQTFAARLQSEGVNTWRLSIWANNTKNAAASTFAMSMSNRTIANTWVGRSLSGADHYAAIDFRECLWYDDDLSDGQVNVLIDYLQNKYTSNVVPWFASPPIPPTLSLTPNGLISNAHSSNVFLSVDQNAPNLFRTNGVLRNATTANLKFPAGVSPSTGVSWTVGNMGYGNGTYSASASTTFSTFLPVMAFDGFKATGTANFWHSDGGLYNASTGAYTSTAGLGGILGEWLRIDLPQPIVLTSYQIWPRSESVNATNRRSPKEFVVIGLYGSSWVILDDRRGANAAADWVQFTSQTFNVVFVGPPCSSFAIVTTVVGNTGETERSSVQIQEWELYGQLAHPSAQLSINHGASGEYSDWIVRNVMVFNNTLRSPMITSLEQSLIRQNMGLLEMISNGGKNACAGAYSVRLLTRSYNGPTIRIRRSTDNTERDFYANALGELGDAYMAQGRNLFEWLAGATAFVVTLYDQSGNGLHATQTTTSSQPIMNNKRKLVFNGSNLLVVPYSSKLNTVNYTYMIDGKLTSSTATFRSPVTSRGAGTGYILYSNNALQWSAWHGFNGTWEMNDTGINVLLNQKYRVVVSYNGTANTIRVNNVSQTVSMSLALNTQYPLYIGAGDTEKALPNYYWIGEINHFVYFNAALATHDQAILDAFMTIEP
jgi:hypothetical protein